MTDGSHAPVPAPVTEPISFSIDIKAQHQTVRIIPAGEVDLATVGQLQSELEKSIEAGFARIVIDLHRLDFLDSTGLHAMLSAHARAEREDWQLAIIPGPGAVQRIFEITGTIDRLPFVRVNGRTSNSEVPDLGSPGSLMPPAGADGSSPEGGLSPSAELWSADRRAATSSWQSTSPTAAPCRHGED